MKRGTLAITVLAVAALAFLPGIAVADDSLCGYCNEGCNGGTFLGMPQCGTEFGSCAVCRIDCENGFYGTTCRCNLFTCATGDRRRPEVLYPRAELRGPKGSEGPCRLAQLPRKSYRSVRVEVYSARS